MKTIDDCLLINLPLREDNRGSLSYLEANGHVPFSIKRVFYMFNINSDSTRGGHSLKKCNQLVLSLAGKVNVAVDDSRSKREFFLDDPTIGLFIPHGIWRDLNGFSTNSICLVLASEFYSEADYFRDYADYVVSQRNIGLT